MTAGVGLPLIVGRFGGDPVIMSALGMLSGFCGTLIDPNGCQLQHRAGCLARTARPQCGDQGADPVRAPADGRVRVQTMKT